MSQSTPQTQMRADLMAAGSSSHVVLDEDKPLRRLPHTPELAKGDGYAEKFDHLSLFYDVFRSASGRHVYLMGPMATNLGAHIAAMQVRGQQSGQTPKLQVHEGRDVVIARVALPQQDTQVRLTIDGQTIDVDIQPSPDDLFKGKRVIMTISRNNKLEWIADWAHFYAKEHGANAVLFYDNNSDLYTPADIQRTIEAVEGIDTCLVVPWNYTFGMKDYDYRGPRGKRSFGYFAQPVMFPHALRKYAQTARSLLNVDIDELVISPFGKSVFKAAERALFGSIKFNRIRIENTRKASDSLPRHGDYVVRQKGRPARIILKKWALKPSRAWLGGWQAQPGNHAIYHWFTLAGARTDFYGYHFEAVSTSWHWDRTEEFPFDPKVHEIDPLLKRTLTRVFGPSELML